MYECVKIVVCSVCLPRGERAAISWAFALERGQVVLGSVRILRSNTYTHQRATVAQLPPVESADSTRDFDSCQVFDLAHLTVTTAACCNYHQHAMSDR